MRSALLTLAILPAEESIREDGLDSNTRVRDGSSRPFESDQKGGSVVDPKEKGTHTVGFGCSHVLKQAKERGFS
ncbi:hypothetical protein IE53DRAFT_62505 [Violaceomyces palustris]|uniref:Uncharacterized protein n=1 Tax=Violaceomyces palustris TaxID=1673888 RepID=A0ACD0NZE2_9BASI|nr:hypothetical protein IE53DRAFT_62505 [Violaceomyces palustris]